MRDSKGRFIRGLYLNCEICAFSGDSKSMWLIVFDGKYNHMLFNMLKSSVLSRFNNGSLPSNDIGYKLVEYYFTFDNAVDNLVKVVAKGGFLK